MDWIGLKTHTKEKYEAKKKTTTKSASDTIIHVMACVQCSA